MKLLLLLAALALAQGSSLLNVLKQGTVKGVHPGSCPATSGMAGICVFIPGVNCLSDSECQQHEKCCSEGCGRVCKKAIDGIAVSKVHAGRCPADSGLVGICVVRPDNCFADSECGASEKCCSEGCGKVCKTALH